MYGALWRVLPGPVWVRILTLVAVVAIVLFCLQAWVFPWINSLIPISDATVEQ
jgi:hypothetical protein